MTIFKRANIKADSQSCGNSWLIFILLLPLSALVMFFTVSDLQNQQELRRIVYIKENFDRVNKIIISGSSQECRIDENSDVFGKAKELLYPLHPLAGGMPPSSKRVLQRRAYSLLAKISFYEDNARLVSIDIYTFINNPFSAEMDSVFANNVFTIDNFYAIAFVSGTNHMGSFGFDSWENVKWISQHCQ